ncbi:MAG: substrate-binding domain-containing protein [Verrucomicrobiota bacterium JB024]|nr:substrate-binding domain-containing protein [Verrucomicrobiota bacterium JB024]
MNLRNLPHRRNHLARICSACLAVALCSALTSTGAEETVTSQPKPATLRVAVIGGIVMSGLWSELSTAFTEETGIEISATITGNKEVLLPAFRKGQADVIAMHASDEITTLVAEGWADGLTPWTFNDLVFVGPANDPAGIRGLTSGAEALKRISQRGGKFIYPRGAGQGIILNRLFKESGVSPSSKWCEIDSSPHPWALLQRASSSHAYTVVGRIPVAYGKLYGEGLEVLVEGDRSMRRPYVVAVANPSRVPDVPLTEARALAAFLVSERAQMIIRNFTGPEQTKGKGPFFFPLPRYETTP